MIAKGTRQELKTHLLVTLAVLSESDDGSFISTRKVYRGPTFDVGDDVFSRLNERHVCESE